jgi:hypothetical protein
MKSRTQALLAAAALLLLGTVVPAAAAATSNANHAATEPCRQFRIPADSPASLHAGLRSARAAGCGLNQTSVDFGAAELGIPESGSWVVGHFDRIAPLASLDAGLYRTHDDHLVAMRGGAWTGRDADVAEAKSAMASSESAAPTAESSLGALKAQKLLEQKLKKEAGMDEQSSVVAASSTTGKCSTDASYVLKPPYLKSMTAAGMWEIDWYYNPAGQPTSMNASNVNDRVKQAPDNWEFNVNNCGMTNWPNLTNIKMGTTSAVPNQTAASCLTAPAVNVVGWHYWGTASGVVANTCSWGTGNNGKFSMAINGSFNFRAAASISGCSGNNIDLEGTLTHEWGHALGLNHISTYNQVMNPYTWYCDDRDRYLGRGDFKGVKAIYGVF